MHANTLLAALACAGILSASPLLAAEEDHSTMDHSKMDHSKMDSGTMDHSQHSMGRDELGRSGYGMKHQMDPALTNELRKKIEQYNNASDAEIALSMDMMGMEYAWYISPTSVRADDGVLILTHGFREQGDKIFKERVQPIAEIFPTSLGVGMAMMMSSHVQTAVDDLKAAGAKRVIVIPVTSSATNELYRQWLYIFGKQDQAEFASVPRVKTDLQVTMVPPPGDNPLVAEILLDNAKEISTDPKKEAVFIVGHGPSGAADNERELKVLAGLSRIIQEDGDFASVQGRTLQDDAPEQVRAANVAKLRGMIEAAQKDGKRVLVITNLISARSIQSKIREDLQGLDYQFNNKGIVEHPNFMRWMMEAVRKEVSKQAAR